MLKINSLTSKVIALTFFAPLSVNVYALSAAEELNELLKPIKSFKADFEQSVKGDKGRVLSTSSGTLKIQRPGQFYWATTQPSVIQIVSDGQFIWTYDKELDQIIKKNANQALTESPAALLAGQPNRLEKDFSVKYADAKHSAYILESKREETPFKEIKLQFKQKQLDRMEMKDGLDNTIEIAFKNVQTNKVFDSAVFVFHPPKGVDIIVSD